MNERSRTEGCFLRNAWFLHQFHLSLIYGYHPIILQRHQVENRVLYKLIACSVFRDVFERIRGNIPDNVELEETWLDQGLHVDPIRLNALLSEEIERTGRKIDPPDAVLLLYGLCSRGIAGIRSGPLTIVVPRVHDCVTLFLGSRERYLEEFSREPGTYWFTQGFAGNFQKPGLSEKFPGIYEEYEERYRTYLDKFGDPELARFVIDAQEQAHITRYSRGVYIENGIGDSDELREKARIYSEARGWRYEEIRGNDSLIRGLFCGDWDERWYLVVKPNEIIVTGGVDEVVTARPDTG